jgi:hypothetical protein
MEERATVGTIDTIVWSAKHEMKKFVKMSESSLNGEDVNNF